MATGVVRAYRNLDVPVPRFVLRVLLPAVGATVAVVLALRFLLPRAFETLGALLYLLPAVVGVLVLLFPVILADSRRHDIERALHLFVTHMAVLATSHVPRAEILRLLSEKEEYGPLAGEVRKVFTLVATWNMGLAEACRLVSKTTPSRILEDFLDRFAHSLDSGEDLEVFLQGEQDVVMKAFATAYRGSLYQMEAMKNLYTSLLMSLVFLLVFALFVPILTGLDPGLVFLGAALATLVLETTCIALVHARAPVDPLWHGIDLPTDARRRLRIGLAAGVLLAGVAAWATLRFGPGLPVGVQIALGLTPLAVAGVVAQVEEARVLRREESFPAFIRSLGASVTARGGSVDEALAHLRHHDFGPLTGTVRDLHQRLAVRVERARAWTYFAAESGSRLLHNFSRIFVEGLRSGGRADRMGVILSDNAVHVLTLRKERAQFVTQFRALLAGLVAGVGFSVTVGVGILGLLQRVFDRVTASADIDQVLAGSFSARVDLEVMQTGLAFALLAHAAAAAAMVHFARGGHPQRTLVEFVAFVWIAAVTAVVSGFAIAHIG